MKFTIKIYQNHDGTKVGFITWSKSIKFTMKKFAVYCIFKDAANLWHFIFKGLKKLQNLQPWQLTYLQPCEQQWCRVSLWKAQSTLNTTELVRSIAAFCSISNEIITNYYWLYQIFYATTRIFRLFSFKRLKLFCIYLLLKWN